MKYRTNKSIQKLQKKAAKESKNIPNLGCPWSYTHQHIAYISYGKDSMAMLEAIKQLGYQLDRIVTVDVWATKDIPADLPEMVEFKKYADEEIYKRYGIVVEHYRNERTYEDYFYDEPIRQSVSNKVRQPSNRGNSAIRGFPMVKGAWCNGKLKVGVVKKIPYPADHFIVQYIGIAADEPIRIERQKDKEGVVLPLVDINWKESDCRAWCEKEGLLSPIYQFSDRGGCWFCHNQGVDQLRILRRSHPELWSILLRWDKDSPICFKPNEHTLADYDKRFALEDKGIVKEGRFIWSSLDEFSQQHL